MNISNMTNSALPSIGSINDGREIGAPSSGVRPSDSPLEDFGDLVSQGIGAVNKNVKDFEHASEKFAKGEKVNIQELMVMGEKADISLKLMTTLRNKVIETYQEIMRLAI